MALLQTVRSNNVNPNRALKHRVNQIVGILSGTANGTVKGVAGATQTDVRDAVFAMLNQLPTANPGPTGFWLNAGVVTKGT